MALSLKHYKNFLHQLYPQIKINQWREYPAYKNKEGYSCRDFTSDVFSQTVIETPEGLKVKHNVELVLKMEGETLPENHIYHYSDIECKKLLINAYSYTKEDIWKCVRRYKDIQGRNARDFAHNSLIKKVVETVKGLEEDKYVEPDLK